MDEMNGEELLELAEKYLVGDGVAENAAKAIEYLNAAIEKGNHKAISTGVAIFTNKGDFDKAIALYQKLVDAKDAEAVVKSAPAFFQCIYNKALKETDENEFKKAVAVLSNHFGETEGLAHYWLGLLLLDSKSFKDESKGKVELKKALESGYDLTEFELEIIGMSADTVAGTESIVKELESIGYKNFNITMAAKCKSETMARELLRGRLEVEAKNLPENFLQRLADGQIKEQTTLKYYPIIIAGREAGSFSFSWNRSRWSSTLNTSITESSGNGTSGAWSKTVYARTEAFDLGMDFECSKIESGEFIAGKSCVFDINQIKKAWNQAFGKVTGEIYDARCKLVIATVMNNYNSVIKSGDVTLFNENDVMLQKDICFVPVYTFTYSWTDNDKPKSFDCFVSGATDDIGFPKKFSGKLSNKTTDSGKKDKAKYTSIGKAALTVGSILMVLIWAAFAYRLFRDIQAFYPEIRFFINIRLKSIFISLILITVALILPKFLKNMNFVKSNDTFLWIISVVRFIILMIIWF